MAGRKTLVGLNAAVFLMMLGVGMIVALLPQKIIDLSGSTAQVGYLASAFAFSYILLQVPIGKLSDIYGFKRFLILGYLICCITGVLYYVSDHAYLIFLGRVLQGMGEAPVWALAPALLSIEYPQSKGKVMGIYNASIHLGLTFGPIIGIVLASVIYGSLVFVFYAAVCLIGAVILVFCVDKNIRGDQAKASFSLRSFIDLFSNKKTLTVLLGIMLYGAGYGIFLTTIPAFLISARGYSQTFIGIFFSLFYIAISLSQVLTGYLSDKTGREIFMRMGLLAASLGIAAFIFLHGVWLFIFLSIASLGLGVFYLASMAFLNEIVPDSLKGTISGSYYLFWGIGFFFGPALLSQAGAAGGRGSGYWFFALLLLLEAVALYFTGKNKNENWMP